MVRLREGDLMPEDLCPQCGQEIEVIWGVTIGDSGDYEPAFGEPVAFDTARCNSCIISFKRADGGPWLWQGAQ